MTEQACLPTLLVAEFGGGFRDPLIQHLQTQGYFVLEAHDGAEVLEVLKIHSRPIHLMLIDGSAEGRSLAATAKMYRRGMTVLFVGTNAHHQDADLNLFSPDQVLAKVNELVGVPKKGAERRSAIAAGRGR